MPAYDADDIGHCIAHVAGTENSNVRLLERARRHAQGLVYENIVEDRAGTLEAFARVLGVPFKSGELAGPMAGELRKIGDEWNVDATRKSRFKRADFVAHVEAARLIRIAGKVDAGKLAEP